MIRNIKMSQTIRCHTDCTPPFSCQRTQAGNIGHYSDSSQPHSLHSAVLYFN